MRRRPIFTLATATASLALAAALSAFSGSVALAAAPQATPLPSVTPGTTNPPLSQTVCRQADFSFVIDTSSSIGNASSEENAVNGFVNAFQAGVSGSAGDGIYAGTRFSALNSGNPVGVNLTSGFVAASTFKTAVTGIGGTVTGYTPTADAINKAVANTANDRAGVPNVLFVVTDGSPNVSGSSYGTTWPTNYVAGSNAAVTAANNARSAGWIVKVIYVGTPDSTITSAIGSTAAQTWVNTVMDAIGGGSYTQIASFNDLVPALFVSTGCPTPTPSSTPTPTPSSTPTPTPSSTPTATPTQVVEGETATPTETDAPTEVVEGETATPVSTTTLPPTSTNGGSSNGGSSMPLFVLLIGLAFGGLGLAAVQGQRKSIRD